MIKMIAIIDQFDNMIVLYVAPRAGAWIKKKAFKLMIEVDYIAILYTAMQAAEAQIAVF